MKTTNRQHSLLWVTVAVMASGLVSCHFGDEIEKQLSKYDGVVRDITFTFSASKTEDNSATRVSLTDNGLDGVASGWESTDEIALFDFGQIFTTDETATTIKSPKAIEMKYDSDAMGDTTGVDYANFTATTRAIMTESTIADDYHFGLFYPYGKAKAMSSASTSITLDFSGQNGSLNKIAKNFFYAWGYAKGTCQDAKVVLKEAMGEGNSQCNNAEWHPHNIGENAIVLDNKMAIIRMHMVVNASKSFSDYLTEKGLEISKITVTNRLGQWTDEDDNVTYASDSSNISAAELDLQSGTVSESASASPSLVLDEPTVLNVHKNDTVKGVYALTSGSKTVWGSTFYVAVPCPETVTTAAGKTQHQLTFRPLIEVETKAAEGKSPDECPTYWGSLSTKELKEGDYYITDCIMMSTDKTDIGAEADIYLYYHSSFLWNDDDVIILK